MKARKHRNTGGISRRAQVEIVGLMIIVVIITLILLFSLYYVTKPRTQFKQAYDAKDMAANMVGALLSTHSNCTSDTTFDKILMDCARYPDNGGSQKLVCDNGMRSCEFAHDKLGYIFSQTLDKWKMPYEFRVEVPPRTIDVLSFKSQGLDEQAPGSVTPYMQPLRLDTTVGGQTMEIILCIGGKCEV
jgi:hypothetical protein